MGNYVNEVPSIITQKSQRDDGKLCERSAEHNYPNSRNILGQ